MFVERENSEEVNFYLGKSKPLQEGNSDKDEESEDDEPVEDYKDPRHFWFSLDNAYGYSSSMRYDLNTKNYTTWVTDDPDDLRCLYYLPVQGVLKLVRTGKRGKLNNVVLKDMDWNKFKIYSKKIFWM